MTLFCKILLSISLFFYGLILGIGWEEFHHRAIQWLPAFKNKSSISKSILENTPDLLLQKLQKNSKLMESWKFSDLLLVLQNHYIKNREKLQETFALGEKKIHSDSAQYAFWRWKWAETLYKEGYLFDAKKMLEENHFSYLWIEPELLMQKGLLAYKLGEKKIAFQYWKSLEKKFPFSKAFKSIKKEYNMNNVTLE